jgi:hypothetical protein
VFESIISSKLKSWRVGFKNSEFAYIMKIVSAKNKNANKIK